MKKNKEISIHLLDLSYKNIFRSLFQTAYMITGNERKAEGVLMKVMSNYPAPETKDQGEIFEIVKEESLRLASPEDSSLFSFSGELAPSTSPITEWLFTLDEKKARVIVLRYAIDLSLKEIASVTGESVERIKGILEKGKLRSFQETRSQKAAVPALKKAAVSLMNSSCFPPDYSCLIRSIEKITEEKTAGGTRSFSVKPVISWLITGIMMLFITLIVWMSVVLIDYFRTPAAESLPKEPLTAETTVVTEG